ncbi:MAG: PDZ domain-containing protein [Deltaproteobacteria bacterium]|nr:PDZ domain-containing protein [Deltaproteobacteria bacterium]
MLAGQTRLFTLVLCTLVPAFPVAAQQNSGWQGPRVQQPASPAPAPQSRPAPALQPALPLAIQPEGEGHPQVMEMPAAQAPSSLVPQPATPSSQSAEVARSTNTLARPAYLGVTGQTALTCRYPAGVRISHVIEGSPAHQAGLQGEATLSWKQAVASGLALSPAAPLVLPFITKSEHGGSGDLILAVDGKRVHNREEFEQEMGRFRPGDVVYFSVLRGEHGLQQVPVHLTDYPDSTTAMLR